jgi:hypothetical protein
MKKLIVGIAMIAMAGIANAALTAYEPFNYTAGTFANNTPATGTGLTGNWSCGANGTIGTGLSYTALTVGNNALSSGGSRQLVGLSSPLSSGTKYISFLFKASGNMGGNIDGVFFPNNNATCLWFGFGLGPFSGAQGQLGLGSMTTAGTAAQGATSLKQVGLGTYASTYLIVLKIDFDTSGVNDTITVYTNPVANVGAPGVPAAGTLTTYDVGTISKIGLNVQGGASISVDEIRVGDTYGDVVGYSVVSSSATNQTTLAISPAIGKQVSWTAASTNSYQPQKSADNSTWSNLGSVITGSSPNSIYDTAFLPYYRVLELTFGGAGANVIANGSFETPAANNSGALNWASSANTTYESVWVTNQWGALTPVSGTSLLFMEGATPAVSPAAPNTSLLSDWFPVSGGLSYNVKFNAANPVKVGGANPQFRVRFYDSGNAFISEQYRSFASAGSTWTQFSATNTAPANAAFMELFFIQAIGAGASWDWVTLIDDVSVNATATFGPTNVLAATVQSGVTFTAIVQTNGVTAADAAGTVAFQTNSIGLITNGVAGGIATSANAILVPPYTVTAIYSGDSSYIGSTNTLVVGTSGVSVTLGSLSQTYDGTARSATGTTSPSGFTLGFTYNGSASAPSDAGAYQVIGTVLDSDYHGSATNNLVIGKAAATVTLGSLSQTYNGTAKSATATTTPPGLIVNFTYDGSANAPINPGIYQVIGTVADNNYFGSDTNNLVIASGVSLTPTNIVASVSGNQLTLSWPADHLGWILQSQTNSLSVGISGNWTDVAGSETGTQSVITIDAANPTVFFRLRSP